jgi:hypothetical protein
MTENEQLSDMLKAHLGNMDDEDSDLPDQMNDIMEAVAEFVGACAAERWRRSGPAEAAVVRLRLGDESGAA